MTLQFYKPNYNIYVQVDTKTNLYDNKPRQTNTIDSNKYKTFATSEFHRAALLRMSEIFSVVVALLFQN